MDGSQQDKLTVTSLATNKISLAIKYIPSFRLTAIRNPHKLAAPTSLQGKLNPGFKGELGAAAYSRPHLL